MEKGYSLHGMARKDFSEEIIFERTPEWQVGSSFAKYDPGRGNRKYKGHEVREKVHICHIM